MIHSVILASVLFSALPTFTNYPPIRNVGNLGPVVADIESHLPVGHPYRDADKITWVHEGTHGINSQLRNLLGKPSFYVLRNRAIVLQENPRGTLSQVSKMVPISLRGEFYQLYLIDSQRWWNNEPEYLWDELVAYTNGAECRRQLQISNRKETVRYAIEMCVYSTCVSRSGKSTDNQTRSFLMWQIERAMKLYKASGIRSTYLDRLRKSADATELRVYMRDYFGLEFTRKVMGF